jgi:hemolysin activation/secretion protein
MKEVAEQVTALYRARGYLLTHAFVPKQDFRDGSVRIEVVEGKIDKITVEGAESYSEELIRDYFQGSTEDGVFQTDKFQRGILLLNELPNLKVTAHLKSSQEKGKADVVLKAEESKNYHFNLDYNNFGSPITGEHRFGLGFDLDNMAGVGDSLYLRSVISFAPAGSNFYNIGYRTPVNTSGTSIGVDYANGSFTAGREFAILDIRGNADIYTVSVSQALDRSLDFSSTVGAAISYKDSDSSLLGLPQARDRYWASRLSWQGDWRDLDGRSLLQASWTQGLGGMETGDPLASRLGASSNFTKFNLDLARVQTIDTGLYAIARGTAQFAWSPLYTAEQFALGGPDTVRGYPQASYLGDTGYVLSAELRWSPLEDPEVLQFAAFIDQGGVTRRNALPGEIGSVSLTGAGIGLRSNLSPETSLRLDLGFPLSSADNFNSQNPLLYGAVRTRF